MNTGINILGIFSKVKGKDGSEYFSGTLNTTSFRKTKQEEVRVNLMPSESAHESILDLFRKAGKTPDLLMIGEVGDDPKKPRRKEE